jgi:hypothetical protein
MSPIELIALGFLLLGGGSKKDDEKGKVFKSDPNLKVPKDGLDMPGPAPVEEHHEAAAPYVPPHLEQPHVDAPVVSPGAATTPLQKAATAMVAVLSDRLADGSGRGAYRVEDMEIYKTFQRAARLNTDGYPGKGTMDRLKGMLSAIGITLPAAIPIYPWRSAGGFHHPNAPEMREWNPSAVGPSAATANAAAAKVAPSTPASQASYTPDGGFKVPATPTPVIATQPNEAAAIAMRDKLTVRLNDGSGRGAYRKADMPVYRAFQTVAMKTTPDGFPGPGTMSALKTILGTLGQSLPDGLPVFPFKKFDAPGDIKAKDWNAS